MGNRIKTIKKMLIILVPLLTAVLVYIIFKTLFLIGYVPSASMEPTLKEGDIIFGIRAHGKLDTGDIIIFEHDNNLLVKRIAAVGGETIEIENRVYMVPEDCFFVLGDNLEDSYDSRFWEDPFVKRSEIVAKLVGK